MHKNTPTVSVNDPRGLNVATVSYYRETPGEPAEPWIYRQSFNGAGQPTISCDPRLLKLLETEPDARPNLMTVFSLTGAPLYSESVDAGSRLTLPGVAGQNLFGWDSLLTQVRTEYDLLLRPIKTVEQAHGRPARNRSFYTYGDNTPEAALHNQCGQLIRHDDSAGTLHFTDFALTGGVSSQTRHFLEQLDEPDWPIDETERNQLNETGNGATTRSLYNALGIQVCQEDAHGNARFSDLDIAGQLSRVRLRIAGRSQDISLLSDIHYNTFGNIERQTAGNGVISEARYDPKDGRLLELLAGLPSQPPLQHLVYDYDRVGNILSIKNAAQRTRFFRNQKIEPINTFTYNSLYQLIEANGWQRINSHNGPQEPVFVSPPDPGQLENYRQTFTYDCAGNLKKLVHSAASHSWTQQTAISKYSNRGLAQKADGELPGESEITAGFDANGNKRQLMAGQDLIWSLSNHLRQVDQVTRENGPNDSEIYRYDESGQRKRKIRIAQAGSSTRTHEVRYLPGLEIRTSPEEVLHVISVQAGRCAVQVLHWEPGGGKDDQYRYSLSNHLGSSTLELDQLAELISEEMYYPYGGTSWWAGRDKVQASYRTRRFSGQERDATGLYYYGQRYYAPWLERWLNADPAGSADGLNLFTMVHGNPVRLVDVQGLAGVDTVIAVGATAARELPSALIAAAVQYAVTALMSPMSMAVTVAGATAGAISGGVSGYASANWAQSRVSVDDPSGWGPLAAKVGGAVLGAALGAAPSLLGMLNPKGNTAAASQIGSAFGTAFRELSAQYFADAGPSNPSVGRADFVTGLGSMGAVAGIGGAVGFGGSLLFGAEPAGKALQSIVAASTATAAGAAGASAVRGLRGTPTKQSKGSGPTFDSAKAVVGSSSRHFFSSLGQLANLAVAQIPGYNTLDENTRTAVTRAVGSAIGDLRSTFVTTATPGLSAELRQTFWDLEKNTVGAGITREGIPTSSDEAYDPAATEIFYITSETTRRQRSYSRSNLRHMMTHM
ncbi:RHS repeat-associated core domain-containing protein [Pseudomonas sp. B21-040]|uniref:RHS repeat-associated core domain-containing protein n=1 Tax=Pseudomonas sp. B21-040 TaxID=2895486 RepID=UPI002160B896|nr:RHS repeat-associated core domain-containing protein [Pseudomonas sp. B21-040]UVL39048.1 RHS repeat-associated core domain-containing protein [Pseudomonas sp. B21-040]